MFCSQHSFYRSSRWFSIPTFKLQTLFYTIVFSLFSATETVAENGFTLKYILLWRCLCGISRDVQDSACMLTQACPSGREGLHQQNFYARKLAKSKIIDFRRKLPFATEEMTFSGPCPAIHTQVSPARPKTKVQNTLTAFPALLKYCGRRRISPA